ncbi:MAG: hypothetical protein AABM42_12455 [Actinomycetota bacterium]
MRPQNNQPDNWLALVGQLLSSGVAAAFWLAVLVCLIAASV